MGRPGKGEPATSPRRVATALRRGKALEMRAAGKKYDEIYLALGYANRAAAVIDVQRALAETVAEPAAEVRALEILRLDEALGRLDEARAEVLKVMARRHVTVSNGKVVSIRNDQGVEEPLPDDDPILRSVDRLLGIEDRRLRIQERRAKYLGLDAPSKVEVLTLDAIDAEIARLTAELRQSEAGEAAAVAGAANGSRPAAGGGPAQVGDTG